MRIPRIVYISASLLMAIMCALFFLLLTATAALAQEDPTEQPGTPPCIAALDVDDAKARYFQPVGREYYESSLDVLGPNFLRDYSLLIVVQFAVQHHHPYIYVCDALADGCNTSTQTQVSSYVAASRQHHASLGPAAFDFLTLGAMDASERTNITIISLPALPCNGLEEKIHGKAFQLVLKASAIARDKFTLMPLCNQTTVHSSQANLFMSVGLLSLFLTFILIPPLVAILLRPSLIGRISKYNLEIANFSMLVTASLVSGSFIVYLLFSFVLFYLCKDSMDHILFKNSFFSPMTQCIIFYILTGITSFMGGIAFSRCHETRVTLCKRMASGLMSACIAAAIFHSFFLFLAFLEDPVTILAYLGSFLTTIFLLFLALYAIVGQYRRARFSGNFLLVLMMEMTLSTIYIFSLGSFRFVTNSEETFVAEKSYLFMVLIISPLCIAISLAIISMTANGGRKRAAKPRAVGKDVENPAVGGGNGGGGGGGSGEMVKVGEGPGVAGLTAMAQEMGFIVLIPDVMQAWKKRQNQI